MYFAAKLLGRCHWAERPTTATVLQVLKMRRILSLSSTVRAIDLMIES
jgi:hypothetical protein